MRKSIIILSSLSLAFQSMATEKPNILFLFTDDQRGATVHDVESQAITTPHIDSLAKAGVSFSNCYLFGANNGAVCKPSRAQLMTGRTFFQLPEVVTAGWAPMKPEDKDPLQYPTFPELLKKKGYRTFATGKQHNGSKWIEVGFDEGKSLFLGGMGSHYKLGGLKDYTLAGGWKKAPSQGVWSSEVFANAAIDFIERQTGDKPFFAYVSFTAPHDPRTAPEAYHARYPAEKMTLPKNFKPEHPFPIASMRIRDEKLAPFPRPEKVIRKQQGDYYAMIEATDHQIGRILEALKKSGHEENTIIIFSSDNGLAVGQHGLMGKQNVYEHSIRLPMVIKGPGLGSGKRSDAFVYLHDLAPTVLDMVGASKPDAMHAQSFWAQVKDPTKQGRDVIYSAYDSWRWERGQVRVEGAKRRYEPRGHGRSLRQGEYKLIVYHMNGKDNTMLFNLDKDPMETVNLAETPEMQQRITQMKASLVEQMKLAGDQAQLEVPGWGYPEDRSR